MKKQTILLFGILVATMSSCVYSLFPIYTEDTLVFKEELLGKWNFDNKGKDYLLFETMSEASSKEEEETSYKYTLEIKEGFTMSSNDPIFIMEKGEKVFNEDSIRSIMLRRLAANNKKEESEPIKMEIEKNNKPSSKDVDFNGTVAVYQEKSYRLTVHDNDKDEYFTAHLVDIGGDLFLDLYPIIEYNSSFSENFFPVHTFFKLDINGDQLDLTFFDLDKLNKLFESNLIRLRHENVDGTILITAQPKELQKFLDKYSEDESVFEDTETYSRAI